MTPVPAPSDHLTYVAILRSVERLYRQFMDLLDSELIELGALDINNVQGLILFNIGHDEVTISELVSRRYYLGSNVSYNVRKLVECGYLTQSRSQHDKRSTRVRLTEKGLHLRAALETVFDRQTSAYLDRSGRDDLQETGRLIRQLGEFWLARTDPAQRSLSGGRNGA